MGVGLWVAVGATDALDVAVAADVPAFGGDVNVPRPGIASHPTTRIASSTARALILLG
jgi:hypothetical protein